MLFVQATLIDAVLILLPLLRFSRKGLRTPGCWSFLVYFGGLGAGFIMIEIALLGRFTLYLGQPVYTLAVVLAGLLVFTGVGSYLSSFFHDVSRGTLTFIFLGVLAMVFLASAATEPVFSASLGLPLSWRAVISLLFLAPIGIALGMPFPTGLRLVGREAPLLIPWAWGVNGFLTVIGSVGAMMLGMAFGFTAALTVAGAAYLAAFLAVLPTRCP
jgi:hypothetical protein